MIKQEPRNQINTKKSKHIKMQTSQQLSKNPETKNTKRCKLYNQNNLINIKANQQSYLQAQTEAWILHSPT
jgi:hypothetical protein